MKIETAAPGGNLIGVISPEREDEMESFYTVSTLHLIDSCEEIAEDDTVKIKVNDGSVFNGQVSSVNSKSITLTFNDYIDGEITISYDKIDTIELISTT